MRGERGVGEKVWRGVLFEGLGESESQAGGREGLRGQLGKRECGGFKRRGGRGNKGERADFLAACVVLDGGSRRRGHAARRRDEQLARGASRIVRRVAADVGVLSPPFYSAPQHDGSAGHD